METPDLNEYLCFADKISDYSELFFIFMPHPNIMQGKFKTLFKPQIDELFIKLQDIDNVYIDMTTDYRPSLLRADAIIIDRSAIMIEAGITGKPILYLTNSDNPEKLSPAVAPLVESFYQGTKIADITLFVQQFRDGHDPRKQLRQDAFSKCVPYTDGLCGKRIADDIADSINREKQSEKVRVAIFGIGTVFNFHAEYSRLFSRDDIEIVALSDNRKYLWGDMINGVRVIEPEALRDLDIDILVIFSERYYRDIFYQLVYKVNIDMDKIERSDQFLLRLAGE